MRIQDNLTLLIRMESVNRQRKNKVLGSSREETNIFHCGDGSRRNRRIKENLKLNLKM